ncbi:hypothetical protein [Sphingomonas sp. Mn802worker]|uniref:hypothetical protein n=1 Tax=Sphingomonas sp. Mn802worker TaxID=629773 RepID=UPI00036E848F|nr:hypothetical protein [Sphingomonas sp. Mn802worker]
MTEASWSGAGSIEWTMSASLEDVTRGGEQVPEVTSLERATRAWQALPPAQRSEAVLTAERPVTLPGELPADRYVGDAIGRIAALLPSGNDDERGDTAA